MTEDNDNIPSPDDSTVDPPEISPAPSPGSMSDPLIGTKIGSCTLKRLIGSGGMGTVYEAIQEKPRRRVALKMMPVLIQLNKHFILHASGVSFGYTLSNISNNRRF